MSRNEAPPSSNPRPFVIAAFFDGDPIEGGGYVHKLGTLNVLRRLQQDDVRIVVICSTQSGVQKVQAAGLQAILFPRPLWRRILGGLSTLDGVRLFGGRSLGARISPLDRLLRRLRVDLVFFAAPDGRALQLFSHNYVFSVWDLCHLDHPEFPEVSHFGEFERRERLFSRVLRKAVAIITDSEFARPTLARAYGVNPDRVHVAPFLVGAQFRNFVPDEDLAAEIRERYGLKRPYVFYPAQFWAHKNHRYVLAALRAMRDRYGWCPHAVFCGSDRGAATPTREYAQSLGIAHYVIYCGFVPDAHMPYLYRDAMALVMPTYFGPTNIPPLEALALGIPVCYSDFPSFRAQLGDRASYVDLDRPESLADALQAIHERALSGGGQIPRSPQELAHQEDQYLAVLQRIVTAYRLKVPPATA